MFFGARRCQLGAGHRWCGEDRGRPCITWRLCCALEASLSFSNHLENEERLRTPEVLIKHGIRRAMNVILQEEGRPFGVLEVGSRSEHEFSPHDIAFLQGAANLLGMVIERERCEPSLKTALERRRVPRGGCPERLYLA
jgi:GAF domain-containing protein